jgi:hypothetical protein
MKAFLYSIIFLSMAISSCTVEHNIPKETTGTYRDFSHLNNRATSFSVYNDDRAANECWIFKTDNIWYTQTDHSSCLGPYWVDGTSCYIKYDPSNPSIYEPIKSKPLFYTDESTTMTNAKVLKVSKKMVKFSFEVNTEKYTCYQYTDKEITEFKKGNTIQIEYWDQNPHRSIILFKKSTYQVHVIRNK